MTTGYRAIPVDYSLAVCSGDDDTAPQDVRPPTAIRVTQPAQTIALKVWFLSETEVPANTKVRLVGLGEAILGRPRATSASDREPVVATWHEQIFDFQLPATLLPGDNAAAVEWLASKDEGPSARFDVIAVGEVVIAVDDISDVSIELSPKVLTGLLGQRVTITLTNRGPEPVAITLGSYAPSNGWPASLGAAPFEGRKEKLSVDFSPPTVELAPGQRCFSYGNVRRRVRWFGRTRSHVFDIAATSANGSVTATSTFEQRPVIPSWLPKVIAIVALVVLVIWALIRVATAIIVDSPGDAEWARLPPAEMSARTQHTATWVEYTRPERDGISGVLDSLLRRSRHESAVIVWGGETAGRNELADGKIYSDSDHEWKQLPPLPDAEARVGHTAVWTGDQLVVWGGFTPQNRDPVAPNRMDETPYYGAAFDPVSGTWTALPDSDLSPRVGHSMIWTGDALIVFGGTSPDGEVLGDGGILRSGPLTTAGTPTASDVGDLTSGVWSLFQDGQLGSFLNAPRAYHAATFDGRYMVVSGGIGPAGDDAATPQLLNDAYTYDVQRNRWATITNSLFERRACHQMVVDQDKTVVLGGLKNSDIVAADLPDAPVGAAPSDPAGTLALSTDFCVRPRPIDRKDPAAFTLELAPPEQEPGNPTFAWTPLTDAPDHLGANFAASATEAGVGIAVPVASLDGNVPISYTPGEALAADRLPSTGALGYRSQLIATWEPTTGRLFLWGGRGPGCGADALPAEQYPLEEPPVCLQADGARIDAVS